MKTKWLVVTDWETRIYRASYLVEQDMEDGEEIGDRIFLDQEYRETDDSGHIETKTLEDFIIQNPHAFIGVVKELYQDGRMDIRSILAKEMCND